jgi:hypothetical protein
MEAKWVRLQASTQSPRRIVIRYDPNALENVELERLLAQIPFGMTNKTMLECVKAGAKAMLRKLEQQAPTQGKPTTPFTAEPAIKPGRREAPSPAEIPTEIPTDIPIDAPGDAPARAKAIRSPLLGDGKTTQTQDEPAASDASAAGFSKAARRMFDQ